MPWYPLPRTLHAAGSALPSRRAYAGVTGRAACVRHPSAPNPGNRQALRRYALRRTDFDCTNLGKAVPASICSALCAWPCSVDIASSALAGGVPVICWHICTVAWAACSWGICAILTAPTSSCSCTRSSGWCCWSHCPNTFCATGRAISCRSELSQSRLQTSRVNFAIDTRHCFRCAASSTLVSFASNFVGCDATSNTRGSTARTRSSVWLSWAARAPSDCRPIE